MLLKKYYDTFLEIIRLPIAKLCFDEQIDPGDIRATYRAFTRRHPRYRIIRAKTIGAALIDLTQFSNRADYLEKIGAKNHGGHHARRARTRGYRFAEIDRNNHIDEIHAINTSLLERQGRTMDEKYVKKTLHYESLPHFRYYGVFSPANELVAYANLGIYGNFAAFSRMLGIRNNDGIMHLLLAEAICRLIDDKKVRYVMYDTFFGAQPGMRTFKTILGFQPYRARYVLQ